MRCFSCFFSIKTGYDTKSGDVPMLRDVNDNFLQMFGEMGDMFDEMLKHNRYRVAYSKKSANPIGFRRNDDKNVSSDDEKVEEYAAVAAKSDLNVQ